MSGPSPVRKVFIASAMISNSDLTSSMQATMNHTTTDMITDDMSDSPSSPDSTAFDDSDLLTSSVVGEDEVTAQLAASGPVGVAAAAAIATAKKRKRPHSFETNPSIRKRQQTRLLRKMKTLIDEYSTRVGQQVVVLQCTPGKPHNNFKVFGAKPLEGVIRNCRAVIMQELEQALAQQAPPQPTEDPTLHELPPLMVDGIPTPVEKMTQAQLRTFIPLMLKYSTGRGKPGWGKESTRPIWWPKDLPWANVRSDVRTEEEKQRVSWTHALRQIVINCYKHHGRDDLLPQFSEDDEDRKVITHYTPTMVQTISNPDGTVSIIHVDPTNAVVTLPDGTQAQVQAVSAIETTQGESTHSVQTLTEVTAAPHPHSVVTAPTATVASMNMNLDLNGEAGGQQLTTLTEATINQDGQLILTGEDGSQDVRCVGYAQYHSNKSFPVSGMVTIPVSMYQTVVANISQLTGSDGHTVTPIQVAMPHPTVLQSSMQAATPAHSADLKITDTQSNQSQQADESPPPQSQIEILHVHSEQSTNSSSPTAMTQIDSNSNGNDLNSCTESQ